jgi:hypothetical protein
VKRLLLLLTLALAVQAHGAITRTQAVSAVASSVTITSTAANDVIIVWAFNNGATTIPTLASGFTDVQSGNGTGRAARFGYKISSGGDTSSGTWTNANNVVCMVYSGVNTTTPFGTIPALRQGAGATLTYSAATLTVTDGTSVWIGAAGMRAATAGMDGTPTGTAPNFTNRTNTTVAHGLDTSATATNLSAQNLTTTSGNGYISISIELLATPTVVPGAGRFFQLF